MRERIETYQVQVYGLVQGVGFRLAALRQAHALKVTGWVRNLDDGSVQAMVQGNAQQVDEMLQWFNFGSARAKVTRVQIERVEIDRRFDHFNRR